ncbi:MAG: Maf family protein [Planctomycetota bacterium]
MAPALVLASASPRRSALLAARGVPFEVQVSHVDEDGVTAPSAGELAMELARRKAQAVAERLGPGPRWVLGADTVVALGEDPGARLLGKPEGPEHAQAMLEALSGSRHRVITGVCVVRAEDGAQFVSQECTIVSMRTITPAEVQAYVVSGEWQDKAGGYAIQETADAFVTGLEGGGFDNVVGLPVDLVLALLARSGLVLPPA